jgi:hypothetical protein
MDKSKSSTSPSFFSASFTPAMLEEILQRIDENLYLRPLLAAQAKPGEEHHYQFDPLPLPPTPPSFFERITEIRNAQAPYYVVSGNFLARLVKRTHNLALKLFGRKQAYFNNLTLNLLESMADYLHVLQEHNKAQSSQIEALARQVLHQTEQFAALQIDYQKIMFGIKQIATRQDEGQELEAQVKQPPSQQNEKQ